MTGRITSLHALHWAVGLVCLLGAVGVLLHGAGPAGLPMWLVWQLALCEVGAAALFLLRPTKLACWALMVVLAEAAILHIAVGEMPPMSLIVYVLAIVVVHEDANERRLGVSP